VNQMQVLSPASPQAGHVATLFWWMLGVSAVVYVAVLLMFLLAAFRRRRTGMPNAEGKIEVSPAVTRRLTTSVVIATGATVLTLLVFLVTDFAVGRTIGNKPDRMLTVEVTGQQWWWEFTYKDPDPSLQFTTANEVHVPVGVPIQFQLRSRDVIHSVWLPNLRGKRDMVPGYVTSLWFRADTPGVYRGQCAEFCGHQHAKMAMVVIAEPRDRWERWVAHERLPSTASTDSLISAGQKVFLTAPCSNCHTIRGTDAAGTVGPDLTHLMSRTTIAAASLPNTRGHLAGWIVDPQSIKPGARMPANQLGPNELQALLAYLETLR
jgi:cytochrome c oxidase subunit II